MMFAVNVEKLLPVPVLLLVFVLAMPLAAWAGKPLRTASEKNAPPFSYLNEAGDLSGFDIEITNALCKEMQRDCEIVLMEFDDIIPAIANGQLDMGVASFAISDKRREIVAFTDSYYRSHSLFIKKTDNNNTHHLDIKNLNGIKAGTQKGTLQENYLRRTYGKKIEIILQPDFGKAFQDLQAGKVDVVFVDALSGYTYLKTKQAVDLEPAGEPIIPSEEELFAHIAVNKKDPALRNELNKALQGILRNGEYERISNKYFDFNVY